MEIILLIVMTIAVFAFGYIVVRHFRKFMKDNYQGNPEPNVRGRKIYLAQINGKNGSAISEEVDSIIDSFSNQDECEIIITKPLDDHIIDSLEESGYMVEYDLRQ